MSTKCPTCQVEFEVDYVSKAVPVFFSECQHVICYQCSKWNAGGGAGAGIGHYKGKERGSGFCTVCEKMRFADGGSDSDDDEIRYSYEKIKLINDKK